MSENDIFDRTKEAYLLLVHPVQRNGSYDPQIASVIDLASSVPDELISAMIVGVSWRSRLLGLCMAMARQPATFATSIVQSLMEPRGIAIVPACAALAVLARSDLFSMTQSFAEQFDRRLFDGEIGWAADKALCFAGLLEHDVSGRGPNHGQVFEDHAYMYSWAMDT